MSKREGLIEVAQDLLWERGYEGMSPRSILERSGAGQGSLYHHFSGKVDLASRALSETEAEMRAADDEVFGSGRSPLERVEAYLRLSREPLKGCRLGRLAQEAALGEHDGLRAPVVEYFEHVRGRIAGALEEARASGELSRDLDAGELAAMIIAVVQGGYVLARAHKDARKMDLAIGGALSLLGKWRHDG